MQSHPKLIAGNWKMNGMPADIEKLAGQLAEKAAATSDVSCDIVVCPPAPLLHAIVQRLDGSSIKVGGQDCHKAEKGAHTGDIAASLLSAIGCSHVILGHSERRADHGESSTEVAAKAAAAIKAGLVPIICVGETLADREAGRAEAIVLAQLRDSVLKDLDGDFVIAYEPVWAIGTGRVPTISDITAMHGAIRQALGDYGEHGAAVPILYGGSAKPDNAGALLAIENVGGLLVGGASLDAESFWNIVSACD